MLVNGVLFNTEVWYGLTQYNVEELEDVDKNLLRRILDTPISTPIESLYLEMGCIPLRFIIMGRRIMYLHYLINLDTEEMLYKFFIAQWENPVRNDWTETIKKDLEFLKIKADLIYSDFSCPLCLQAEDRNEHLLLCIKIFPLIPKCPTNIFFLK